MLLNEPSPHSTRPAAATAAAAPGTVELPPVEVDGAMAPPRASAEADTVSFGAVDRNGNVSGSGSGGAARAGEDAETNSSADPEAGNGASAGSVSGNSAGADSEGAESAGDDAGAGDDVRSGGDVSGDASSGDDVSSGHAANADGGGRDAISTVALDVEAVKRAVAEGISVSTPDATSTVSLDVAAVKRATAAQAPTVAFAPVDPASIEAESAESGPVELATEPGTEAGTEGAAELATRPAHEPATELAPESADDAEPDSGGGSPGDTDPESASASADLVPSSDTAPDATSSYLASTVLSTASSSVVAVPETADDVIATIHAAATAVAAADRRARQAAVFKEDPWTDLDLHRPGPPAPVGNVLDLLAPVLERPLLVVEQPGLPAAADVVALHRSELQQDFVEPPVVAAGAEPPIPPRYGPGLSVLPHIEFPV